MALLVVWWDDHKWMDRRQLCPTGPSRNIPFRRSKPLLGLCSRPSSSDETRRDRRIFWTSLAAVHKTCTAADVLLFEADPEEGKMPSDLRFTGAPGSAPGRIRTCDARFRKGRRVFVGLVVRTATCALTRKNAFCWLLSFYGRLKV